MRVAHLASYDEWTGATAVALAEVEALRGEGVDARFLYRAGGPLEETMQGFEWAVPLLGKGLSSAGSLRDLRRFLTSERIELVHAHLSHDHWMAALASGRPVIRTFHSSRPVRSTGTRLLLRSTSVICVSNASLASSFGERPVRVTPPPLHDRFSVEEASRLQLPGIPADAPLAGFIGKIALDRGFDHALEVFSRLPDEVHLLVLGDGDPAARRVLVDLSARLGIAGRVHWYGHAGGELPDILATLDLLLYTVPGSEEGHRAVMEALGCGTPVAAFPAPGLRHVIGQLSDRMIAPVGTADGLASTARELLRSRPSRAECERSMLAWRYDPSAARLVKLYEEVLRGEGRVS